MWSHWEPRQNPSLFPRVSFVFLAWSFSTMDLFISPSTIQKIQLNMVAINIWSWLITYHRHVKNQFLMGLKKTKILLWNWKWTNWNQIQVKYTLQLTFLSFHILLENSEHFPYVLCALEILLTNSFLIEYHQKMMICCN